uniref:ATP synthase complex subunit 8 n=1 Tax=Philotrypesis sp. TL-2019 TaxID=2562751 RepID=A0A646QY08_9HYME|nr:ATP8 [Philotrypesis sp. TL-2019]QBS00754.1 ATP8 [Philotrypesis sp. TL-2019]
MPQMSPLLWFCMFLNMMLILIFMIIIIYFIIFTDSLDPTSKINKMKLNKFSNSW